MTTEEFNRIVDKYLAGEATPAEAKLVETFFEAQEKNQAGPDAPVSESIWQAIDEAVSSPSPERNTTRVWRRYVVFACGMLVLALLGYIGQQEFRKKRHGLITRTAPYGEKSIITLTDGSKVILNSGSSISFPKAFCDDVREVTLTGEAFFEVADNPLHPFHVRSGDLLTRVVGTSFNVQAFDANDISVTVATGRVQVIADHGGAAPAGGSVESVFLEPFQQVTYHNDHLVVGQADMENSLAWKNNTLRFDETPLSDVGVALERWYGVTILFESDIVHCKINGTFKDQNLEEVLKSIRYMYNVDFRFTNQNQITLYGKGCKK